MAMRTVTETDLTLPDGRTLHTYETGTGDLAVQETPIIKRWNEAFARREGGKDKADALYKRYSDMVLQEKIEVASRRSP